jgi:(2R)-3-sulfolactate dehydrogenase (NADP+)
MKMTFDQIVALASSGLQASGIDRRAAIETAEFLALAEADGLASHGLARVGQYAGHAMNGRIELKAQPRIKRFKTAAALVDACDGLAFPAL